MKRQPQMHFDIFRQYSGSCHGGDLSVGKRKVRRPLAIKRPIHVVMRSTRAKGKWSLRSPQNLPKVIRLVSRLGSRFDIKIYQYANAGNHLHLLIKAGTRGDFQNFLRSLAGLLACLVTGAKKGMRIGKFWGLLAFSRVVEWGKAFSIACKYIRQNELEAQGVIPFMPRFKSKGRPRRGK